MELYVQLPVTRGEMKLDELIHPLDRVEKSGDLSAEVTSLEFDSRKVKPGSLFFAVQGFTSDGNEFIQEAAGKGAVAVVTSKPGTTSGIPVILVPDVRKAMAIIADRFYGSPQNSLVMAAVTGTNGKTTISYMVKSIFEAHGVGCGLIGTISHIVGSELIESVNTTPESTDIHHYLSMMVKAKQSACIMEASSHALVLSRIYGIQFRAVAFTNITREHLDFHGTFHEYLNAKSILFSNLSGDSTAVINLDDPYADHIISVSRGGTIVTHGYNKGCDIHPLSYDLEASGSQVVLSTPSGDMEFRLAMPGKFNISNAMAATGIGLACGLTPSAIARGLESLKSVRGRYEIIDEGQNFTVIVDYAHTPDALEKILTSVREITKGQVISVFGCGGDRDRGKRPMMGEISTRLADYTIVTSDNPRTEVPEIIIEDILKGIPEGANIKRITDREEAIREALEKAVYSDSVVIAGKGHEDYQIIGHKKYHFDDAESVRRLIKAMKWKVTHSGD